MSGGWAGRALLIFISFSIILAIASASKVVILTSDNPSDLLLSIQLARANNASLAVTRWGIFDPDILEAILSQEPDRIYVIGGYRAVPLDYKIRLDREGIECTILGGRDRQETAIIAYNSLRTSRTIPFVCDGRRPLIISNWSVPISYFRDPSSMRSFIAMHSAKVIVEDRIAEELGLSLPENRIARISNESIERTRSILSRVRDLLSGRRILEPGDLEVALGLMSEKQEIASTNITISNETEEKKKEEPFARIRDDLGREIILWERPKRIVTLSPSLTEIVCALGGLDELVGVDQYSNYPPEVEERKNSGEIAVIGGYATPDPEQIVALDPDLVIMSTSSFHTKILDDLEEAGITVACFQEWTLEDVKRNIIRIGVLLGRYEKAKELVSDIEEKIDYVSELMKNVNETRVYFETWPEELGGIWTIGSRSYISELIDIAGGENIFSDVDLPGFPLDDDGQIIERDPEVILTTTHGMFNATSLASIIASREGWENVTAIRDGEIYVFFGWMEDAIVRASPRLVYDPFNQQHFGALDIIAEILHPDRYPLNWTTISVMGVYKYER